MHWTGKTERCDVIVGVYLFVEDAIDGGLNEI